MRTTPLSNLWSSSRLRFRDEALSKVSTLQCSIALLEGSSLERIHYCLKKINSRLWRELRNGSLTSCYVGLYNVGCQNIKKDRDWREVNRRTVSSLNRFATSTTEKERHVCLQEALRRIGHKLFLVQLALKKKTDRPTMEEKCTIQSFETELRHLSCLLGAIHKVQKSPVIC
jgi:hypothetical protein